MDTPKTKPRTEYVHVLTDEWEHEGTNFIGVFASRKGAIAAIKRIDRHAIRVQADSTRACYTGNSVDHQRVVTKVRVQR